MNEALCSILSGEDEWAFDKEGRSIKFNSDGTGELWCRCNFNYWIVSELEWKCIKTRGPRPDMEATQNETPRLLGQLDLEMTLTKRLPPPVESSVLTQSTLVNGGSLKDDAFRPKSYAVTIEQGNFKEPFYIGFPDSDNTRFALRLLFDKSPYPPRSEWKKPEQGPDGGPFWHHTEFVSRVSSDLGGQRKAMNDVSGSSWDNCVIL